MLMRLRLLLGFLAISILQHELDATSCLYPPPCARISPASIFFVGTVIDPGTPSSNEKEATRDVTLKVTEIFAGLSPSTKEAITRYQGSWLEKGHTYLIDAYKGEDNRLGLSICGSSAEVDSESAVDVLKFLRLRAQGKTSTSLSVRVFDDRRPVPDAAVMIRSQQEQLTVQADADGNATFTGIKPAKYSLSAVLAHYKPDPDSVFDKTANVAQGACSNAVISIKSDASVSGQVVNSKEAPVAALDLQLVSEPDSGGEISLNKPFFLATTDTEGRFQFESVSPGRYQLGSNIIGLNDSSIPPTYYPGQRTRSGAYPIEVKLGESVANLRFTLPDFGARREIQICVVDENRKPASSTDVLSDSDDDLSGNSAELGKELTTDETGCVSAAGYTRVRYSIHALLRRGANIRLAQDSDSFVIIPGEEPVLAVLVLHAPGGAK